MPIPLHPFPFDGNGVTAVVTTRHGGVSTGVYASLNLGAHVQDDPEAVRENRDRVARALGVSRLTIADQRHTARVAVVEDPSEAFPATDAMITSQKGTALAILVADCVPVVFFDPVRRAAGVAHSGRVGTTKGVVPNTIETMARAFGSSPADLLVGLGPAIGPASYEIGAREAAEVREHLGPAAGSLLTENRPGHALFDLKAAIRAQLRDAKVNDGNVHDLAVDTRTATETFFSDRAARPCGRFAAAVVLR